MLAFMHFDNEPVQVAAWGTAGFACGVKQSTIVIASANQARAQLLAALLREDGDVVTLVHDRSNALRAVAWQPVDLVIMDAQLAGDDGIALCASLKRDTQARDIPVIITADPCSSDEHLRAVEADADDYLSASNLCLVSARAGSLLRAKRRIDSPVPLELAAHTLGQAVEA